MNNTIYKIRENKDLYIFLKYNSNLYKNIVRKEINIKELDKIRKENTNNTIIDKMNKIKEKIELANTFWEIIR